ncbi:hypothetical protein GF343_04240, partial [Candidatus Woesearchaeota archaeon]|nr:hypothetical protein [Candidatus Woesearchaeota archaeon]
MEQSGGLIVPSYIKRVLGKATGIASALTLGVLSYTAAPAKAEEIPKKIEDPNLARVVADSYAQLEKGKERDDAIAQLTASAYQDPEISFEDRKYILDALAEKISDPDVNASVAELVKNSSEMQLKEETARRKYFQETKKAEGKSQKETFEIYINAAKEYFTALRAAEGMLPNTQYAQGMLKIAKYGLKIAKKCPGLGETDNFKNYVAEAKKAVEQAAKEEHLLSQMMQYDSAIETALANAEQE